MPGPDLGVHTAGLIGLEIDETIPSGLIIGGWSLVRLEGNTVHRYDAHPSARASPPLSWDTVAASYTWWLRRPSGRRPALKRTSITMSDPTRVGEVPLVALALAKPTPLSALSHVVAQPGHGVKMTVPSRDLEYIVDEDGVVHPQHGPYHVDTAESDRWAHDVVVLGDLVNQVFAEDTKRVRRFQDACRKFLRVSGDLYGGMAPEPRLPLEMSTALELLLLTESRELEISERVRRGAAALAGAGSDGRGLAAAIYDAGSRYRHGSELYRLTWHAGTDTSARPRSLSVEDAYGLLRRLLLNGLAVLAEGESLPLLCDRAQRDSSTPERAAEARERIRAAVDRLQGRLA